MDDYITANLDGSIHVHEWDANVTFTAPNSIESYYTLDSNMKISHKFRWVKKNNIKVLQCRECDEWVDIPFIEDPDAEKYPQEINDLCKMD